MKLIGEMFKVVWHLYKDGKKKKGGEQRASAGKVSLTSKEV